MLSLLIVWNSELLLIRPPVIPAKSGLFTKLVLINYDFSCVGVNEGVVDTSLHGLYSGTCFGLFNLCIWPFWFDLIATFYFVVESNLNLFLGMI